MTFVAPQPNQTYHPRVYAAFGFTIDDDSATWVWTNITAYVRPGLGPVTCSGGRNSLAGTADPAQITLTLDNTDGRFTARSPLLRNGQPNPYFPNVVRNTPLKVAITWDGATAEYELLTTFVNGWPIQPNAGVINVSVPITASGRLRRLRRTNKLARSALFRAITIDNNITYDGYWAMEDKTGATQFAATSQATPIQPIPMPGVKRAAIASITAVPGSDAITDFSSGVRGTARPAQVNSSTGHVTDFVFYVGDTPSGSGLVTLVRIFFPNGSYMISLDMSGLAWQVDLFDTDGATVDSQSFTWATTMSPFDGQPHMFRWIMDTTAGFVTQLQGRIDGITQISMAETIAWSGNVRLVGIAGKAASFPLGIAHLMVMNTLLPAVDNTDAMRGFAGEGAGIRIQRLCDEENIPVTILFYQANQPRMGPQLIDTIANLLDGTADADDGLLHDAGTNGDLVYASRSSRYEKGERIPFPIGMTLDYNQHQIGDGLVSTYDDQDLITSTTATRTGGSSYTYTSAVTSELYAASDTVNVETDAQLQNIAGWRTHVGTFDAYRLPSIEINLRATPNLADEATSVVLPFRLSPINLPTPYPPGSLDQFAEAFVTTIDSVEWRTTYSCQPYGPYDVAVWGTDRYDAAGTVLTAAESNIDTAITVTPAIAGDWTLAVGSYPFTVTCDQEQMLVGNVVNGTSIIGQDGTLEVVDTSAWTPTSCTLTTDNTRSYTGTRSAKLVVTGTPSQAFARMPMVSGIVVGDTYTAEGWLFSVGGYATAQFTIDWFTGASAFISTSNVSLALGAATWTRARVIAVAPATAAKAQIGPTLGGSPGTGTTMWADNLTFTHRVGADGSTQTFTVIRGSSGVRSAHLINRPVHIYPLPIYAL